MTAQRKTNVALDTTSISGLHSGEGVEMFSTSSTPTARDTLMGDGVHMFSTSSAPTARDVVAGDGVEMFSTSSAPAARETAAGDGVELFSTSSAPAQTGAVMQGELTNLFSSGS
ncbi:DUF6749 domain-containing protein [uncultured Tateyamaria sp.]|uniref:DUF6749 domain-containing protein n=1 Tax=uncultured Tateyamaria sp. TaxID=455651 RepID=UPI0026052836|nr:DUF6749 domain-containing protein [uncultured Tateyamaria sp.]